MSQTTTETVERSERAAGPCKPVRAAAVGLGWVTRHRHLPVMEASGDFELVGVIDRAPGRAQRVAADRGYRHFSQQSDLARVQWLDQVDAVTIGTSPFSHYELAKSALELGKHVLTEKPFALRVDQGEELVELAGRHGLCLAIVHNFQFARSTRKLLRDIESGRLGEIRSVMAVQFSNPRRRLPAWYEQLPLGLFYDESPHLLYLLRRVLPGELRLLSCEVFPSMTGSATPASIHAYYCGGQQGIPVELSVNFQTPLSEWHLLVMGDEYLGDIDVFRDIYLRLPNDGLHLTGTVVRTSLWATWQHWLGHLPSGIRHLAGQLWYGNGEVFRRFAEAVRTGCVPEGISSDDALAVLRMQHDIVQRHEPLVPGLQP